jgi:D-lyxose ketol-isomerase
LFGKNKESAKGAIVFSLKNKEKTASKYAKIKRKRISS